MRSRYFHIATFRFLLVLFLVMTAGTMCLAMDNRGSNNVPQPVECPLGDMSDTSESETDDKESDDDNLYDEKLLAFDRQCFLRGTAGEWHLKHDDPDFKLISPPPWS